MDSSDYDVRRIRKRVLILMMLSTVVLLALSQGRHYLRRSLGGSQREHDATINTRSVGCLDIARRRLLDIRRRQGLIAKHHRVESQISERS